MTFTPNQILAPQLAPTGLESGLSEEELAIQEGIRRFARNVLRPVGTELDRLSPEEVVAPDSKLWDVLSQAKELGLSVMDMIELEPLERARILALASEELAWGDAGLAGAILVNQMPVLYSLLAGNAEMASYCDGKLGCWAITEPDHGTDMLDADGSLQADSGSYGRPNCVARFEGDKIIINGQKSAWVSGAITAEVCALYCHYEENGQTRPGIAVIVPLDSKGVSKGKPLDKTGLRALNQGEIYFDNVEVSLNHLLAGPEQYNKLVYETLAEANVHVGNMFVGVARAAYEHALEYAHERKQGGLSIIRHQNVRYRLFHMFRKVETARALLRRTTEFNALASHPALQGSIATKITCTQTAFEVASDALQIFGGNGVTKEYPMEKLLRDARSGMIADGCNEILAIKGGTLLINNELI
ncbi:MAG: acyl-CoA dehydrogenase [Oceanospirillales bacterium]|nr:acyl-CoA dehydrogenase [Oceanospirillales bacterium]MBR9887848.1 acyl-CoA dehydrogenase [Oceanospirillales bacterium]